MGWTYCRSWTRDSLLAELNKLSDGYTLLGTATTGRVHWQAVERKADGARFIVCNLIRDEVGQLGHKMMDETMGPCYYDCPLRLLALCPVSPGGYADEWRAKVRQHHWDRARA